MQTEWSKEFPVFRRITSNESYTIHGHDTFLPNDDFYKTHPEMLEKRKRKLKEARQDFVYKHEDGLPVMVKKIPYQEWFSFGYAMDLTCELVKLYFVGLDNDDWGDKIEDFKDLYTHRPLIAPSDLERWTSDEKFGLQRLLGVNSNAIRRVKDMAELKKLQVHEHDLVLASEKLTVKDAFTAKRLFIVDHGILQDCPTIAEVILCCPIALFVRRSDGMIVPVAIQLFQNKSKNNPVFLPSDDEKTWQLAKMWFNNADAQVHQSISHLGYTHLIMEGFAVAAHRHLSTSHPIFKLLAPHFLYLMKINMLSIKRLLGKGEVLDEVMSSGAVGGKHMIAKFHNQWRLNVEGTLPADLKARGVEDKEVIPNYPFRDDALLTYNAIKRYVGMYVNLYYASDKVLQNDYEVQDWRHDMDLPIPSGGLGVADVPGNNGMFQTRHELTLVVTSIIYTCSVGHAAVNFKQYEEYAFPLNYPSKLNGTPPTDKRERTERDIIAILPPKPKHFKLMKVANILSNRETKALGDFEVDYIQDPDALELVNMFRKELETVSQTIKERNKQRPQELQYAYLDPQSIPNSISI
ncbi:LOX5-like protein [Mya arenaria]|uniref:LOX5-like protein n=1 Tax=Mya arenaria TaxID=6604 RepID=A0ABY7FIP0_MYAAR|nr:polyunsaturated fatty acid 5-lipoxygenase-like [Mya arenaria]WAR22053.1 LOX5-like protein [Mya arenaria]